MLVKCKLCSTKLERNDAYKVTVNGKNEYYCNEKEYQQKLKEATDKENVMNILKEILDNRVNYPALNKELKEINTTNSYEKIYSYLYDNKSMLEQSLNKSFSSEYARIRYLSAIIKNHIVDYIMEDESYITDNEYEILDTKYKQKKKRRAMCDIEKELLEDG